MSRTIWKFPLHLTDIQTITAPSPTLLTAEIRNGVLCVWAIVTPGAPEQEMQIAIYGTGREIDMAGPQKYLGTVFDGPLVWHVFGDFRS